MGFSTLGPVLGSVVVTEVSSHTLAGHPDWQFQLHVCGAVGLVVWLITLIGPGPARSADGDDARPRADRRATAGHRPRESLRHQWRQMLKPDVIAFMAATALLDQGQRVAQIVAEYPRLAQLSDPSTTNAQRAVLL